MTHLQKHKPIGESTGDDTVPPLREDVASSAEQAGEVVRPNHWLRSFLLLSAAFLIAMAALQWADVVEWVEGEWRLNPKREAERDKQMRKIDDAEQYAGSKHPRVL